MVFILTVLVLQLAYGAFMAGNKAATAAPTWPDINGELLPGMLGSGKGILFWIENKIAIHFVHRGLAYILLIAVVLMTLRLHRPHGSRLLQKASWFPIFLVLLQVLLGILSVLYSTSIIPGQWGIFEWMAQLHQLVAMLLLLSLVLLLYLTGKRAQLIFSTTVLTETPKVQSRSSPFRRATWLLHPHGSWRHQDFQFLSPTPASNECLFVFVYRREK
ncbi:MAG: hypothetical protein EBT80_10665 [Chitinophagales bacterium]|nr:hypothetical protein [Chitinophagales bacterium]